MGDYIYYPGCSLEGSARAYASSLSAIVAPLGVKLHEIDDWNCCGATEYMTLSPLRGHALIARNLALAEAQRDGASPLVAPCSACYVNLAKTDRYYRESSGFAELVNKALSADNLHYDGGALHVRHLLEVLVDDVGVELTVIVVAADSKRYRAPGRNIAQRGIVPTGKTPQSNRRRAGDVAGK